MLSYWEKQSFFDKEAICIIGSGIVGLTTAIFIKKERPNQKVIILEKGSLPSGASSKNAGFSCFGSASEILDDINTIGESAAFNLVEKRWEGLRTLRSILGDEKLKFNNWGGFELFTKNKSDIELFETCQNKINDINSALSFIGKDVFTINPEKINAFGFNNTAHLIQNQYESQIDTGSMITNLIIEAQKLGVLIINGIFVSEIIQNYVNTNLGSFEFKKIVVCTNGFAKTLLPNKNVLPARAQVLITKPIKDLKIKGTFHYDKGYYYFRNIDNRILIGGGRNLDFNGETTTEIKTSELIQNQLEKLLLEVVLPENKFEVDIRWAGIMGVGNSKEIILEEISNDVICAIRLGGMGVAIGSLVGKEAANMVLNLC